MTNLPQQREALEIADLFSAFVCDALRSKGLRYKHAEQFHQTLRNYILNSTPVPEGWQLVPVEPTEDMLRSADESDREYTARQFGPKHPRIEQGGAYDHYVAMLAAAPKPEDRHD